MDEQNWTIPTQEQVDAVAITEEKRLKLQQELWIDYCAIGGIVTSAGFEEEIKDGRKVSEIMKRMTVGQFSQEVGVPRSTLYSWNKSIPDFAEKVRERRNELWSVARETAIFNRLYLIGMSGNGQPAVTALTVLAGHFSKLQTPTQRVEAKVESNSWSALISKKAEAIEGEVVNESTDDNI